MKYATRLTLRQVLLAFDLYIKRVLILASDKEPARQIMLKRFGHKLLKKPTPLPKNLSLKSIAARSGMSTGTLNGFISGEFRLFKFNRAKLAKHLRKYYRP